MMKFTSSINYLISFTIYPIHHSITPPFKTFHFLILHPNPKLRISKKFCENVLGTAKSKQISKLKRSFSKALSKFKQISR